MTIELRAKCHNCGTINLFTIGSTGVNGKVEILFACVKCGALNELCIDFSEPGNSREDWLCLPPSGFEWALPAGKITPVVGQPIYVSAVGEKLSREDYINRYRVDPEIAYEYMRGRRNTSVKNIFESSSSRLRTPQGNSNTSGDTDKKAICLNCGAVNHVKD
ncbi:Uncharacterised protein [uncultured archaeon]|nr:Uncharacterised protein [uncultured archaeon]